MLTALYVVLALIGAFTMVMYCVVRQEAVCAFRVLTVSKGQDIEPAACDYNRLERVQKRFAAVCIACHAAIMTMNIFCAITPLRAIALIMAIFGFIAMLIACEIHNTREHRIRLDPHGA